MDRLLNLPKLKNEVTVVHENNNPGVHIYRFEIPDPKKPGKRKGILWMDKETFKTLFE